MSDIVQRLDSAAGLHRPGASNAFLMLDAAREIERLRLEVTCIREKYYRSDDALAQLRRRIGEALQ